MAKLIIGNWKLNPLTLPEAQELAGKIERKPKQEAVICPPTPFLSAIDYPNLGAQDVFWEAKGPYTGQSSPAELKSLKVKYCIVGHSEKRALGETDSEIQKKVFALIKNDITPVLCVGYGAEKTEDDLAVVEHIKQQLDVDMEGADSEKVVVAYEPVWAIGTGKPATPEHAEMVGIFVKTKYKVKQFLYGGSTNSTNAAAFLSEPHIDGLLVGGASLLSEDFNKMINLEI